MSGQNASHHLKYFIIGETDGFFYFCSKFDSENGANPSGVKSYPTNGTIFRVEFRAKIRYPSCPRMVSNFVLR